MDIPIWSQFIELLKFILIHINEAVGINPGLAIIIFTILVKLITLPLTMTSIRSSRRMQEIGPLMKEVQKRYKDDRAKQQTEVMRIYQEHGVNPMGSCLPMIVQIPIFLALWQALSGLVIGDHANPGFAGHEFLWVPNLAHADPFYIWPVLSSAFQFLSQRMSMPYGANKNGDPQQQMMNKILQFMPLYLLVVYLNFAAGAVIYWTFSSIFTCVQTYFVNGFGSLPDVPGFGWLPKRNLVTVSPEIQAELAEMEAQASGKKTPARRTTVTSTARYASDERAEAATQPAPAPEPKGFFAKMMAQAVAAQEAQQAAKNAPANGSSSDDDAGEVIETATRPLTPATEGAVTRAFTPTAESINRKRRSKR